MDLAVNSGLLVPIANREPKPEIMPCNPICCLSAQQFKVVNFVIGFLFAITASALFLYELYANDLSVAIPVLFISLFVIVSYLFYVSLSLKYARERGAVEAIPVVSYEPPVHTNPNL